MALEVQKKFIQEFKDDQGKVIARWHYDQDKFAIKKSHKKELSWGTEIPVWSTQMYLSM